MGSQSDWETMRQADEVLGRFNVPHESAIVSAHRTPAWMAEYATTAADRGLEVIIAGAGGAAHLPGMVAAHTVLPVIGVPVQSAALNGLDSLLSIVQMPKGVPVATVAIGRGRQCRTAGGRHPRDLASGTARTTDGLSSRDCRRGSSRSAFVTARAIQPGSVIGVLGGGQLGRMFAMAARRMGYRVHTLAPEHDTPTGQIADVEVVASYDDVDRIREFARGVDVVTFEFENVSAAAVAAAEAHAIVRPNGRALEIAQHRIREKTFLQNLGLPVTPFAASPQ